MSYADFRWCDGRTSIERTIDHYQLVKLLLRLCSSAADSIDLAITAPRDVLVDEYANEKILKQVRNHPPLMTFDTTTKPQYIKLQHAQLRVDPPSEVV